MITKMGFHHQGSVLRIHYRRRGGAPRAGQPECFAFVEGRCECGSRGQYWHEQRGRNCTVCGSDDHQWEQCARFGGGRHDSTKDPRVLAAAQKHAART